MLPSTLYRGITSSFCSKAVFTKQNFHLKKELPKNVFDIKFIWFILTDQKMNLTLARVKDMCYLAEMHGQTF